jgi:hypothetical protein
VWVSSCSAIPMYDIEVLPSNHVGSISVHFSSSGTTRHLQQIRCFQKIHAARLSAFSQPWHKCK